MTNIGDCRHCQGWKGCLGKDWYSYAEITWCPQQIFWILKWAETLEAGLWPDLTSESSIAERLNREGYFVKAVITIGQIRRWLKSTNWRGRLLTEECLNRGTLRYLSDDAKSALYYIAESRPRHRTFNAWLADRRYEKKR